MFVSLNKLAVSTELRRSRVNLGGDVRASPCRTPGRRHPSAVSIDRDAADVGFRFRRLRHRHCQHAVFEYSRGLRLLDILQRYAPFEPAIIPLTETASLVLRLRLL